MGSSDFLYDIDIILTDVICVQPMGRRSGKESSRLGSVVVRPDANVVTVSYKSLLANPDR